MARPSHIRQLNQRRIIRALLRRGCASRAELAKLSGMSQPTVGKIVDTLLASGILEETGTAESTSVGRPAQMLRLDRAHRRFLAVELGVRHTGMSMVPVGICGQDRWDVEVETARNPQQWIGNLAEAAKSLPVHRARAVLVSVPGVVDEHRGRVLLCPNLRWAESVNLMGLIRQAWDVPVVLVQEIRALALGQLAAEPDIGDFLLVDFGDGVGGAAVVRGRLFESRIPLSGELGHTPVMGNRRRCGCGGEGCLETLVSQPGLLSSFRASQQDPMASWASFLAYVRRNGPEPWLTAALDATAAVIAGALNVLGIRQTVITGALAELPENMLEYLSQAISRGAMWARFGQVSCRAAPRRRMAGLVSAAMDRIIAPAIDEEAGAPEEQPGDLTPAAPPAN